jgi:hypothetical protein
MKIIRAIVDELPKCCGGLSDKGNVNYHPEPCSGLAFGWTTWCIYTGKDIDDTDTRPDWCPLEVEEEKANE